MRGVTHAFYKDFVRSPHFPICEILIILSQDGASLDSPFLNLITILLGPNLYLSFNELIDTLLAKHRVGFEMKLLVNLCS